MARHVVVSFGDNADAEQFIKAIATEGALFFQGSDGHFKSINVETTKVIGLYAKPTLFCECPYEDEMKTVRSKTYGWYIHYKCNKPIGGHMQTALKNLLLPEGTDVRKNRVYLGVREGQTRWPEPKGS